MLTYQFNKSKSPIAVSNKKHTLSSRLGYEMVPDVDCMLFRRAIFLQTKHIKIVYCICIITVFS